MPQALLPYFDSTHRNMRTWLFRVYLVLMGFFALVLVIAMLSSLGEVRVELGVIAVPALMLADYYLTLSSARLLKRVYPRADLAQFELNPMWKADVANLRRFNLSHLTIVVSTFVYFLFLSQAPIGLPRAFFLFLLGLMIAWFCTMLCHHVCNICWFVSVKRDPFIELGPQWRHWGETNQLQFLFARLSMIAAIAITGVFAPLTFAFGFLAGFALEQLFVFQLIREARIRI